jgi:exonuclease SbcD
VKLLHTSDWHVGKQIRGNSRADEHRAVLREIVAIADGEAVDLVVVAGDLFDTSAPSPESQEIVYRTLLDLASGGRQVVVIAGNHDNARALRAVQPVFSGCGVQLLAEPARPDAGGVHTFAAASGESVNVAMLPFVSQRSIVRADQLMSGAAFEHALAFAQRMAQLIAAMCVPFRADTVNVLAAHAFVLGGTSGGGERAAHMVDEYAVQAPSFPTTAGYVALGHLHKAQRIPAATAMHYCGSPLQLDFGETDDRKQVNVVELQPGLPAKVRPHELSSGRALRTYRGTVDELRAMVADDDAWLRLRVTEPRRAGIQSDLRSIFGDRLVDVIIDAADSDANQSRTSRKGRSPHELFADYLASQNVSDARVSALFAELLDQAAEVSS